MKVLHWNVHMWTDAAGADNRQAVADLIAQESPDVVSLVEVDEPWGRPDQLAAMAERLGYRWLFVPAFEYRGEGGFGNALLVRPEIRAMQQWQLLSPRLYDGTEPSEPRAVVLAQVDVNGTPCWVGSVHLPRGDDAMHAEAAGRLLELLGRLDSPWLVCGNFNREPSAWLTAPFACTPDPAVPTYPSSSPSEAIDYCVLSGLTARSRVHRSDASDHHAVVVDSG